MPKQKNGWRRVIMLPSILRLRSLHPAPPVGVEVDATALSPAGDRLAWACSQTYVSPINVWLHRWFSRVSAQPQLRLSLWVSAIDGSHPTEIGSIATQDQNTTISDIQWLPNGKRLSFVYKYSLYTSPVD